LAKWPVPSIIDFIFLCEKCLCLFIQANRLFDILIYLAVNFIEFGLIDLILAMGSAIIDYLCGCSSVWTALTFHELFNSLFILLTKSLMVNLFTHIALSQLIQ
jgi:hypothetical protein